MEMAQVPVDEVKDAKAKSWNNYNHIFRNKLLFPFFFQVFIQKVIPQIRFSNFNNPSRALVQGCIAQSGGGFVFARLGVSPSYGSRVEAVSASQLLTWMVKGFTRMPP